MSGGDEWDVPLPASEESQGEESGTEGGQRRGAKGRGRGSRGVGVRKDDKLKKKHEPKAKAKALKDCFAANCDLPKKANSKFCKIHHPDVECMRYQAAKAVPPQLDAFNEVMDDPSKAALALEEFRRTNAGGRFRKRLIDWGQFRRQYGVRQSVTERENEELMSVDDYVQFQVSEGKTKEWAIQDWQIKLDSGMEGEGEGSARCLWISKNRTRMRDRTRYIDGQYEEGSRQIKDPSDADRSHLQNFAHSSNVGFNDAFFRINEPVDVPSSSSNKGSQEDLAEQPKQVVEVVLAAPKAHETEKQPFNDVSKAMTKCLEIVRKSLDLASVNKAPTDTLQVSYENTSACRIRLLQIWAAPNLDAIPAVEVAPSLKKDKVPEVESADGCAPAAADGNSASPGTPSGAAAVDAAAAAPAAHPSDAVARSPVQSDALQGSPGKPLPSPSKAGSTAGESLRGKAPGERVSATLRAEWKSMGTRAPKMDHPEHMLSKAEMEESLAKILAADSIEVMDATVQKLRLGITAVKQMRDGAVRASTSLTGHINGKVRSEARKRTAEQARVEALEAEEAKAKAKSAAEKIKKDAEELPPLFDLMQAECETQNMFSDVQVFEEGKAMQSNRPLLVKTMGAMDTFQACPKAQLLMGNFGGSYKKQLKTALGGRIQQPVGSSSGGKDSCQTLFASLCALLPESECVPPGDVDKATKTLLSTIWQYGYESKLHLVGANPNGMGMWKYLVSGEVTWLMCEAKSLVATLRTMWKKDEVGQEEMLQFLQGLKKQEVTELMATGVEFHRVVQEKQTALWVPCGWIAAEYVTRGVLIYGLRKSMMIRSTESASNYEMLLGTHVADKKPVDRMQAALALMKVEDDEDA